MDFDIQTNDFSWDAILFLSQKQSLVPYVYHHYRKFQPNPKNIIEYKYHTNKMANNTYFGPKSDVEFSFFVKYNFRWSIVCSGKMKKRI